MNAATFCVVGMILYAVICTRNIRELYQSERIQKMTLHTIQTLANAIDAKAPTPGAIPPGSASIR